MENKKINSSGAAGRGKAGAAEQSKEEVVEDLTLANLENDGDADRFDEFALGVKKKFRPDWLDSENAIFINKLNHAAKHFDSAHKSVS